MDDFKLPAFCPQQDENNSHTDDEVVFDEDESHNDVGLLQIAVKRIGNGQVACLDFSIEENATVLDLKLLIQDELADDSPTLIVPLERQRLIFAGKMLTNNNMTLLEEVKMNQKPQF